MRNQPVPASHTRVATEQASRCLTRLCRHWSHRFAVELNKEQGSGQIFFDPATCRLQVTENALDVWLDAPDSAAFDTLEPVVAEHLQRMAGDEALHFDWQRSA